MSKKAINKQKRNYRFTGLILGLLLVLPSLIQLGHLLEGHQHLGCNQNSTHLHELDHKCDVLAFHFSALLFSFNESTEEQKLVVFDPPNFWHSAFFTNRDLATKFSRGPPAMI